MSTEDTYVFINDSIYMLTLWGVMYVGYSSWVSLKASFPYFLPIIIPSTWVGSHYIQLINLNFVYKTLVFCSNDVAARKLTAYKPLNWISINPTRWKNKIEWCMDLLHIELLKIVPNKSYQVYYKWLVGMICKYYKLHSFGCRLYILPLHMYKLVDISSSFISFDSIFCFIWRIFQ